MKYRTIVADPPWEYPGGFAHGIGSKRTVPLPYPAMSLGEIQAIPLESFAERDCRLFVWTTTRYLRATFDLVSVWGFTYSTVLVWHKTNAAPAVRFRIAANDAEFVVVGRRGKPSALGHMPQVVPAPVGRHSAKPECFLDYIEQVSPGPYLELFARRNRLGWDTWGNESLEHVELGS